MPPLRGPDVVARDRAGRTGGGHPGEVDTEVLGELADRAAWRGEPRPAGRRPPRPPDRPRGRRAGSAARAASTLPRVAGGDGAPRPRGRRSRRGRPPASARHRTARTRPAGTARRCRREYRRRLARFCCCPNGFCRCFGRLGFARQVTAVRRGVRRVRLGVDGDDRRPHVDGLTGLHVQRRDPTRVGAGQLDGSLGRLDLDDRLVDHHRVTDRDVPGEDLALRQALADVGEAERLHPGHVSAPTLRSTASSTRSRSGR